MRVRSASLACLPQHPLHVCRALPLDADEQRIAHTTTHNAARTVAATSPFPRRYMGLRRGSSRCELRAVCTHKSPVSSGGVAVCARACRVDKCSARAPQVRVSACLWVASLPESVDACTPSHGSAGGTKGAWQGLVMCLLPHARVLRCRSSRTHVHRHARSLSHSHAPIGMPFLAHVACARIGAHRLRQHHAGHHRCPAKGSTAPICARRCYSTTCTTMLTPEDPFEHCNECRGSQARVSNL
jgi:hypothetical protein